MNVRIGRDKLLVLGFFFSLILTGSVLLAIPGVYAVGRLSWIDALFTATSAVCVTGLITVNTADFSLVGQILIMLLIQTGGLGIITFSTIFLTTTRKRISIVGKGIIGEYAIPEVEHRPRVIISSIVRYTLAVEGIGFLFYALRFTRLGYPIFTALFHAVSAFCNAGFSTFPDSLETFVTDPLINATTIALIVSGGLGFLVLKDIRKVFSGERTHLSYHSSIVLKTTLFLLATGAAAFYFLESKGAFASLTLPQKLMASLFQSVTPRTAGFDTIPQTALGGGSQLLTMLLMFIGASPASTGGGVKTTTFFILMMTAFRYKDASDRVDHAGRSIMPRTVYKAAGVVVKGVLIIVAGAILIHLAEVAHGENLALMDVVFEVTSAFGTVGLSRNLTFSLHSLSKIVLIVTMFIGRVGLFAFALPRVGKDLEGYARLPSADILM